MFRSTFGHARVRYDDRTSWQLFHMAIDPLAGTRLFEIGTRGGVDEPYDKIYCLLHDKRLIPFSVRNKSDVGWKPLSDFNVRKYRHLHPESAIRVVDVEVRHVGIHPNSVPKGPRSSAWFMDVWEGMDIEEVGFSASLIDLLCFEAFRRHCQCSALTTTRGTLGQTHASAGALSQSGESGRKYQMPLVLLKALASYCKPLHLNPCLRMKC